MTKTVTVAVLVGLSLAAIAEAERYSVTVSRIDANLYKAGRLIIETRYCYEYAIGVDALLNWEGKYGNNWLLFVDSRQKCDVVALR